VYILVTAIVLIASLSLISNGASVQLSTDVLTTDKKQVNVIDMAFQKAPSTLKTPVQQFQCDVFYAYIGKSNSTNGFYDTNGIYEYPITQYPSAVYLNITRVSSSSTESCDVKFEIYLIGITADKGPAEKYIWLEGTNYNATFSDFDKATSAADYVDDLIDRRTITGQGGHFKFNWTVGTSVAKGCIGSIGHYTTSPSKLGLWSAGQPDTISVSISLLGWITMDGDSISTTANSATDNNSLEIQLQKIENGFIYNKIVPADQLMRLSQSDLFNPAAP
jgi:hypothetical protein